MAGSITNGSKQYYTCDCLPFEGGDGRNVVAAFRKNGIAPSCAAIEKATTAKMEMSYRKPISALPRHQNKP